MMMENAWYPWTKLLAVFYVVFALWLYLAGLRKNDSLRIVSAFLCLAAGLMVHYSAGPYVVFVAGHYLLRAFAKRPHRIRELAAIGVCSALLLAIWFGWSIKAYGVHDTFESNTSVAASQRYQGQYRRKDRRQPAGHRSPCDPAQSRIAEHVRSAQQMGRTPRQRLRALPNQPHLRHGIGWRTFRSLAALSNLPRLREAIRANAASGWHSFLS